MQKLLIDERFARNALIASAGLWDTPTDRDCYGYCLPTWEIEHGGRSFVFMVVFNGERDDHTPGSPFEVDLQVEVFEDDGFDEGGRGLMLASMAPSKLLAGIKSELAKGCGRALGRELDVESMTFEVTGASKSYRKAWLAGEELSRQHCGPSSDATLVLARMDAEAQAEAERDDIEGALESPRESVQMGRSANASIRI